MYSIAEFQNLFSDSLLESRIKSKPQNLYEPIHYILSLGGKRLRPTLVLAACNLFSDNTKQAVDTAIAYEIFHNFTLLHDDVMDNSPKRRGKPTVHRKWNINTAILSGDAMMILAQTLIQNTPENVRPQVVEIFNTTALEVCEGQQLDMDFEIENSISDAQYTEMIRLKTSVLLAACLKSGALIGGGDTKSADLLYNFGLNLGLAFQLQDDYLDVYGNSEIFGKRIGGDIIADKKTFLLIKALEFAQGDMRKTLDETIGNKSINEVDKIKTITQIYNSLKIDEMCLNRIDEFYRKALNYLHNLQINPERIKILEQFSKEIMQRNK
jgi:geranylgeranyl diphosphate synthase type II